MSLRAFARRRGVTLAAVQTAIHDGRLAACLGRDRRGRPIITDAARAEQEWAEHSRPRLNGHEAAGRGRVPSTPLAAATLRERLARAEAFEFETARKKGEWVRLREVDHRWSALVVAARTALLGLPSRAKARLPHLTGLDLAALDALIREALAELAEPSATGTAAPPNGSSRSRRARAGVPPAPGASPRGGAANSNPSPPDNQEAT